MSREERLELIRSIEQKRGSRVITYVTSDREGLATRISSDVVSILHDHILAVPEDERDKLDLFIYSRGGESDVPWSIVSMFREYCERGSFSVLIPYRAHSAATVIALGADQIVMTKKAELGPIDITIEKGPYNPTDGDTLNRLPISVEDVNGYFSLLRKVGCERPEEIMRGFELLTEHVHPLALGEVSRLLQQTELVALKLLGTRAQPFTEEDNRNIVTRLSSEIYSHRHTISRTEAVKQLGLSQVVNAEEENIDSELWNLYNEYRQMFDLDKPFRPAERLHAENKDSCVWSSLKMACVESEWRSDVFEMSIRAKWRKPVPPQVQLNLVNLSLPPVNLGPLPHDITPDDVARMVRQTVREVVDDVVRRAAQEAADKFLASLRPDGIETTAFNVGWKIISWESGGLFHE